MLRVKAPMLNRLRNSKLGCLGSELGCWSLKLGFSELETGIVERESRIVELFTGLTSKIGRGLGWLFSLILAWAMVASPALAVEHPRLTVEILQQQLQNPITVDGKPTLDLRQFQIDLRPENPGFSQEFYRLVGNQLQRAPKAWGLELSDTQICGDFQLNALGLRLPLTGQALTPNFSAVEQAQFNQDRQRLFQLGRLSRSLLSQEYQDDDLQLRLIRGPVYLNQTEFLGAVFGRNTFFLGELQAQDVVFTQQTDWSGSRFSQAVNLNRGQFQHRSLWRGAIFFGKANFNQTHWFADLDFSNSQFQDSASFNRSRFEQPTNFARTQWHSTGDFSQTRWLSSVNFNRSQWSKAAFFPEAVFSQMSSFRGMQLAGKMNLRGASILNQLDFSDAIVTQPGRINIPELEFDSKTAQILGTPGQVGVLLTLPNYHNNQSVIRNLVRNFRQLEQIQDANAIELMGQLRHWQELGRNLWQPNLNQVSESKLVQLGLTRSQVAEIIEQRSQHPFTDLSNLLDQNLIDLTTYVKLQTKVNVGPILTVTGFLTQAWQWLGLGLLLAFTAFGSRFSLILGIGLVAIAYFALVFWLIDRVRRWKPTPILPTPWEVWGMGLGSLSLGLVGSSLVNRAAVYPVLTWLSLGVFLIPVPLVLTVLIYYRGRYHDLMTVSYFVEDGSQRQFRLLIGRLPIMPRFPFFRDRYEPILWNRRWTGLNYFDLSLINFLKFGFNDVRLRDQQLPGLVGSLVWYQWGLGLPYIGLLFWTLSRTIPGLNLFIYF